MSFKIVTDSCANLTDKQIDTYEVEIVTLSYISDSVIYKSYIKGQKTDHKNSMISQDKKALSTTLPTRDEFLAVFEPVVKGGEDLLYIGFLLRLKRHLPNGETVFG